MRQARRALQRRGAEERRGIYYMERTRYYRAVTGMPWRFYHPVSSLWLESCYAPRTFCFVRRTSGSPTEAGLFFNETYT